MDLFLGKKIKLDPWDHIEAAMGLSVAGKKEEAESAFLWLKAISFRWLMVF